MKAMELLPPSDTMYRALVNRDSSFEGIFFVGVRTTGIFCRPTCSAKKPARVNVDFFATPSEALHGGYRPCLRCRPMDPGERPPKLIEQLRAEVERAPGGRLDRQRTGRAIHRSLDRAAAIQAPLWNDISSLPSRPADGTGVSEKCEGQPRGRSARRKRIRIGERIS